MKVERALEIVRTVRLRPASPTSARELFAKDDTSFGTRDRLQYITFDAMPLGLQQWWIDRAEWINKMNGRRGTHR